MIIQKYTKAIMAVAGVLIPTLNELGVPLPEFFTAEWLNSMLLLLTPIAVLWFANKDAQGNNVAK